MNNINSGHIGGVGRVNGLLAHGGSSHGGLPGVNNIRSPPRRPFLHMIVLFGSDPRVMAYAQGVMQKFLSAGVDTWLHCSLSHTTNNTHTRINDKANDIKPEHLVSVITGSHADSLIVIGDRNMKKCNCRN